MAGTNAIAVHVGIGFRVRVEAEFGGFLIFGAIEGGVSNAGRPELQGTDGWESELESSGMCHQPNICGATDGNLQAQTRQASCFTLSGKQGF